MVNWVGIQTDLFKDQLKSVPILLSRTQAGTGIAAKQEQEEISLNHNFLVDLCTWLLQGLTLLQTVVSENNG